MRGLNPIFGMDRHGGKFFTVWYGIYERPTRRLTFSGGGHPPALLLSGTSAADARTQELAPDGPVIGLPVELPFENMTIELPKFANLLLYSDGLFELLQPDGRMATYDSFVEFVAAQRNWDDILILRSLSRY
jgi:sigma-B regulation protein RsbU (phosphoserine phosphatase)